MYIDIDSTLSISDMDFLYQFNLRLHHFWRFFSMLQFFFQKLAHLWLVGEVVNHVGLYGSKVAEVCSAFQRRSCYFSWLQSQLLRFYTLNCNRFNHLEERTGHNCVNIMRPLSCFEGQRTCSGTFHFHTLQKMSDSKRYPKSSEFGGGGSRLFNIFIRRWWLQKGDAIVDWPSNWSCLDLCLWGRRRFLGVQHQSYHNKIEKLLSSERWNNWYIKPVAKWLCRRSRMLISVRLYKANADVRLLVLKPKI